jgi:hypothetical protein
MGRRVHKPLLTAVVGLTMALALAVPVGAHPDRQIGISDDGTIDNAKSAHGHQHGGISGHLPPAQSNVELVGKAAVSDRAPGRVADVNVFGNYAYLAAFADPACERGGVYVFDISDVTAPREVGFIPTGPGSFVGEGVQIVPLRTRSFRGDVLIFNNEICALTPGNVGGATLVDVSDPLNPRVLSSQFGDFDPPGVAPGVAHQVHSAFIWTSGRNAYAVLVDDEESADVDIFDISDPRSPVKVAEYDLAAMFPQILQPGLEEVFFHDVVVKRIGGRQVMLLSYWDAGYVKLDVTDPRQPAYLGDTDFTFPDPELLAQTGRQEDPEGNGHQAEFTRNNKYFIGADEDFGPNGLEGRTDDAAAFDAVPGSDTPQLTDGQTLTGTAVYGGQACDVDPAVPPAPSTGGPYLAVVTRGLCTFTEKVANVEAAGGYAGVVVVNREGSDGCSLFGMSVDGNIPAFSVDRRTGFGFFDQEGAFDEAACLAGTASEIPGVSLGTTGDVITLRAFFNGWGYVHLFANENGKIRELDTYAIGEAMDPRFATGFGDLSVHEVATSQRRSDLAYLSYYAGGFRVIRIVDNQIQEVGRFIDQGGNNFWGVQVFRRGGVEYVAASDRDFGLYIFRYTGRR